MKRAYDLMRTGLCLGLTALLAIQTPALAAPAKSVEEVLKEGMDAADGVADEKTAETTDEDGKETKEEKKEEVKPAKVDLTALSPTMVYGEVYAMLSSPDDYIGKSVRMEGPLAVLTVEGSDQVYYACIIQDATACCAQGMEFVLKDGLTYPKEGEMITVQGIFDTYMEGEYRYCTLRDAVLL